MAAEIPEMFYYQLRTLKCLLLVRGNLPFLQERRKLNTDFFIEFHSKWSTEQMQWRGEADRALTVLHVKMKHFCKMYIWRRNKKKKYFIHQKGNRSTKNRQEKTFQKVYKEQKILHFLTCRNEGSADCILSSISVQINVSISLSAFPASILAEFYSGYWKKPSAPAGQSWHYLVPQRHPDTNNIRIEVLLKICGIL